MKNCKRVCLGLMSVYFHLAKELSNTGMHLNSMLLIVTRLTVLRDVWITILKIRDFFISLCFYSLFDHICHFGNGTC